MHNMLYPGSKKVCQCFHYLKSVPKLHYLYYKLLLKTGKDKNEGKNH